MNYPKETYHCTRGSVFTYHYEKHSRSIYLRFYESESTSTSYWITVQFGQSNVLRSNGTHLEQIWKTRLGTFLTMVGKYEPRVKELLTGNNQAQLLFIVAPYTDISSSRKKISSFVVYDCIS